MHGARNEDMKNENNKNYYTFWWGIGGPNGCLEKSSAYKLMVFNSVRLYEEEVIQPFSIQDSGYS